MRKDKAVVSGVGNTRYSRKHEASAELLGIETQTYDYLATVRFQGLIKEAADASAEPFAEIWNLAKPQNGASGWVLAGIQQV